MTNVIFSFMLIKHALLVNIKIFMKLEKQLNEDFENICDRFVNNELSYYFGDDKTKSILFATKFKIKKVRKLDIKWEIYKANSIPKLNI